MFNFKASFMKRKGTINLEVTPEEEELIKAIRNYCNSYPNGYPDLLDYAEDLFQRMTDMPKDLANRQRLSLRGESYNNIKDLRLWK